MNPGDTEKFVFIGGIRDGVELWATEATAYRGTGVSVPVSTETGWKTVDYWWANLFEFSDWKLWVATCTKDYDMKIVRDALIKFLNELPL